VTVVSGDAEPPGVLDARSVTRSFGEVVVLTGVDLRVGAGRISALLGPNGAGKTTFLRILTGLLLPDSGEVHVGGIDVAADPMAVRRRIGFMPSADRTFYMRISALENLAFFARLHGLRRKEALSRATRRLADVGLRDAGGQRVGTYSHGMQKRLSVARALLLDPDVLIIDEATDGLDPEGARRVQDLVRGIADNGTSVVWTTQRLDEIRGFADGVTVLDRGRTTFEGTVEDLMLRSTSRRYVVRLERAGGGTLADADITRTNAALAPGGQLSRGGEDRAHFRLDLMEDTVLGVALTAIGDSGLVVLDCAQQRSEIEESFLLLTTARE
jgi:ABC-type multidrug transport system ATPase subunit